MPVGELGTGGAAGQKPEELRVRLKGGVRSPKQAQPEVVEPGQQEEEVLQQKHREEEPVRVVLMLVGDRIVGSEVGVGTRGDIEESCIQGDQSHQMRLGLQGVEVRLLVGTHFCM